LFYIKFDVYIYMKGGVTICLNVDIAVFLAIKMWYGIKFLDLLHAPTTDLILEPILAQELLFENQSKCVLLQNFQ